MILMGQEHDSSRKLWLVLWLGCVRRRVPFNTLTLAGLLPRKNVENFI
jgi:hypothetical protein